MILSHEELSLLLSGIDYTLRLETATGKDLHTRAFLIEIHCDKTGIGSGQTTMVSILLENPNCFQSEISSSLPLSIARYK